jgi:hypothetical protein
MQNHEEIFNNSASHIGRILERNRIPGSDFCFTETQYGSYGFLIDITYSFHAVQDTKVVAGGKGVSGNHYNSGGYAITKANYYRYASECHKEKNEFIESAGSNLVSLFIRNESKEVWLAPTFSYSYNCGTCSGGGKVRCISCGGGGRQRCHGCGGSGSVLETQYFTDSYGNSRSENVYRSCNSCGGAGNVRCHACGGSGRQTCSTCSGHGYFTEYCYIKTVAKPFATYNAENGIYAKDVVDYFLHKSRAYLCEVMQPENVGGAWLNNGDYRFSMRAPITVVENTIMVRQKKFIEVAVNSVHGILYPPIFDHILGKDVEQLLLVDTRWKKRRQNLNLYHDIKDHYAIHHALLAYSEAGDAAKEKKVEAARNRIYNATGGYISHSFSSTVSEHIVNLMSRLAPYSTSWPWWLAGFLCLVIEMALATHLGYKTISRSDSVTGINLISIPMIGVDLLFVMVMALPVALLNWMVTRYRQKGIPAMHRPKVHHRKPIVWVIGVLSVAWYLFLALLYLTHRFARGEYFTITSYGDMIYKKTTHLAHTKIAYFVHSNAKILEEKNVHDWILYLHSHAQEWKEPIIWTTVIVVSLIYLLPTIVAGFRRKKHKLWIFVGNLFLPPLLWVSWFLLLYLDFL